jgi:hypothetical protein
MNRLSDLQQRQLSEFKDCFVEHPILTTIIEDFERLRFNHSLGGDQQCMLLTGDTGSGKSHLINYYSKRFQSQQRRDVVTKPLLLSRIPSKLTLEQTIIQLLTDLGQFGSGYRLGKSSELDLTESLVKCLKICETELIIINEFQELIEFKSLKDRQLIANRLKFISEETSIPIVLVGMPWATTIAEEPQWASRLICRRVIPYFKLSDGVEIFVRFLMGLALKMQFKVMPQLEDQHTTLALFSASSGEIRKLKHILNEAVKAALLAGAETLEKGHMAGAVTLLFPDKPNPFLQRISEIEYSEVQSYSRYDPYAQSQDEKLIATRFTKNMSLTQLLKK